MNPETKNRWSRDDPAFIAILVIFMAVAAGAYSVAFKAWNPLILLRFMFWVAFIEFLGIGLAIATVGWWVPSHQGAVVDCWRVNSDESVCVRVYRVVANKYMRVQAPHAVEQKVEWLYAFDIHCNSFFPLFVILYVLQFFLLPLLLNSSFFATVIANSMYALAFSYYFYVTFLGYSGKNHHNPSFFLPLLMLVVPCSASLFAQDGSFPLSNWTCRFPLCLLPPPSLQLFYLCHELLLFVNMIVLVNAQGMVCTRLHLIINCGCQSAHRKSSKMGYSLFGWGAVIQSHLTARMVNSSEVGRPHLVAIVLV